MKQGSQSTVIKRKNTCDKSNTKYGKESQRTVIKSKVHVTRVTQNMKLGSQNTVIKRKSNTKYETRVI